MTSAVIDVSGLVKRYGPLEAVAGIDLRVAAGECVALLGPNGAGKTTTVEILEGHRDRTAGEVRVLGFDPRTGGRAMRERIGIVLQASGLDGELSVREILQMYGGAYPAPRDPDEVIALVGLEEKRDDRVRRLSGGQRRRLDLGLAIVGDPELIFLDEPTTGFDPSARRKAWELVGDLRGLGKTIFLTTHYMEEAQVLADRVAVIDRGRIIAEGDPRTLGGRDVAEAVIQFRLPARAEASDLPDAVRRIASTADGLVTVRTPEPTRILLTLTEWALRRGGELEALTVSRPTLEDVYIELTGGPEEAADA